MVPPEGSAQQLRTLVRTSPREENHRPTRKRQERAKAQLEGILPNHPDHSSGRRTKRFQSPFLKPLTPSRTDHEANCSQALLAPTTQRTPPGSTRSRPQDNPQQQSRTSRAAMEAPAAWPQRGRTGAAGVGTRHHHPRRWPGETRVTLPEPVERLSRESRAPQGVRLPMPRFLQALEPTGDWSGRRSGPTSRTTPTRHQGSQSPPGIWPKE